MQAMTTIRKWQTDHMRFMLSSVNYILESVPDEDLKRYRDGGDGWTVLEVLCHLCDYEVLFHDRIKLMVEGDNVPLPNPDPDQLATESNYNGQDVAAVYAAWVENRNAHLAYLETLQEADWEKPGMHPSRGPFTPHDQLFLTVWHDTLHLEQMTRILHEKQ